MDPNVAPESARNRLPYVNWAISFADRLRVSGGRSAPRGRLVGQARRGTVAARGGAVPDRRFGSRMIRRLSAKGISWLTLAGACLGGGGCAQQKDAAADPARIANPWLGPTTIAVAPALNFSGTTDFDPDTVADLMASELGHVEGINVIPVSRVLAVMARMGLREVGSPEQAREIRRQTGADAILVFAVTEYDPYNPPIVGLATQLYGEPSRWRGQVNLDPILVSRPARPFAVGSPSDQAGDLIAQAQRVFNAAHDYVGRDVKRFAELRGDDGSAYGWRLYLVSQEHYLRFCCSAIVEELIRPPCGRTPAGGSAGEIEDP